MFMADIFTKEKRSEVMRRITGSNTKPERLLRQRLWEMGVRGWRVHPKTLPGKPDVAFTKYRIAVFVDGCFWHGCKQCYTRPKTNQKYWDSKREMNNRRDRSNEAALNASGWTVIRFWEHEVEKDSTGCAHTVQAQLLMARNA
jgi:DNA mismatch endonuclease (patch repair protein)